MPPITDWISRIGEIILAATTSLQAISVQSANRPGFGPPLLQTRMSGSGQAVRALARPSAVSMSASTVRGRRPVRASISTAAASRRSASRPLIHTSTPSARSEMAQAFPRPDDEAQTSARFPAMPRSMGLLQIALKACGR